MRTRFGKFGQVWVETVLYTLMAFTIIALVLAYAKPEIEKFQDKSTIQQSIDLMSDLDLKISEIYRNGEGNKRIIEVSIKKGSLNIISEEDSILFEIESSYQYTEPGEKYSEKGLEIITSPITGKNKITILKNYSEILNITYMGREETKTLTQSGTFYRVYVENKGGVEEEKTKIEFGII